MVPIFLFIYSNLVPRDFSFPDERGKVKNPRDEVVLQLFSSHGLLKDSVLINFRLWNNETDVIHSPTPIRYTLVQYGKYGKAAFNAHRTGFSVH